MTSLPGASGPGEAQRAGQDIGLRALRWWDLAEVMPIEHASFGADAWTPETFWAELAERRTRRYVVAHAAGGSAAVIGYVGVSVVAGQADVQTIATDPAVRGRGVGRTLLRRGLAEAERAGARRIHLEVRADNTAAVALYAAAGFRRTGCRRGYYRDAGGAGVDAVVMSRDLTGGPPPWREVTG